MGWAMTGGGAAGGGVFEVGSDGELGGFGGGGGGDGERPNRLTMIVRLVGRDEWRT